MPREKRTSYTLEQKIAAVSYAEEHSLAKAAAHFEINVSQVVRWKRNKTLMQLVRNKDRKVIKRNRKCHWPELEEYLNCWVINQRNEGHQPTAILILEEARKQAQLMNLEDFVGSVNWVRKFLKRKQLGKKQNDTVEENMVNG